MERLTERTTDGVGGYKIQAKNLDYHCVAKDKRGYVTYYGQHIDKLAEYEDLEEQGLLLRLPCRVGTSVYMVEQDCGGDTLDCMRGDCEGCQYLYSFVEENTFEVYMCDEVGKTVFLTQAEAEQKLKEMESDCNDKN